MWMLFAIGGWTVILGYVCVLCVAAHRADHQSERDDRRVQATETARAWVAARVEEARTVLQVLLDRDRVAAADQPITPELEEENADA